MSDITFVIHQMGTQGSYINHLDMQQYLKDVEGHNIRFYTQCSKELFNVIKDSNRPYKFNKNELQYFENEIIEPNLVITDFKSLIKFNKMKSYVACKKVLIMDSVELTYHLKDMKHAKFYYDIDVYKALKIFYTDEIVFLMPESNYKLFTKRYPDLNAQIFYKNIYVDMINKMQCNNVRGNFYRWDDDTESKKQIYECFGKECFKFEPDWDINNEGKRVPFKLNEQEYIFEFKNFIYRRRKYLEYQEQLGRLIFEYILLGKTVYFMDEPYTDDGLTDYLKHFDIKFEGNKIITTKEELAEKMSTYKIKPWED